MELMSLDAAIEKRIAELKVEREEQQRKLEQARRETAELEQRTAQGVAAWLGETEGIAIDAAYICARRYDAYGKACEIEVGLPKAKLIGGQGLVHVIEDGSVAVISKHFNWVVDRIPYSHFVDAVIAARGILAEPETKAAVDDDDLPF